jgi:hypothetical protein
MTTANALVWARDEDWVGPKKAGWKDNAGKSCCDWNTFWASFFECWRKKHGKKRGIRPSDAVILLARKYWAELSMTGYEAFVTIEQDIAKGKFEVERAM